MSLRHALLGLLAEEPASGYDLTANFDVALGRYAWHAGHSQIYPELNRMAADGLVEVIAEGARGRRTYGITDDGRAELRRWLMSPRQRTGMRSEYLLRLFLLSALDPGEAVQVLREIVAENEQRLTDLRAALAGNPELGARQGIGGLAAEFGLRHFEMTRDWAQWAITELSPKDQAPPTQRSTH